MLTWKKGTPGILEFTLDLKQLYPVKKELAAFEGRWREFYLSDPENRKVFRKKGDILMYLSEEIIPVKKDGRPGLLLIFDNPAPHSVTGGMYFAHEAGGREHRVWKIFRDVGIIDLAGKANAEKKRSLLSIRHTSQYRVGLAVFFSMPSTPSKPPWTGVAGLRRLFGKRAFDRIACEERKRMDILISTFNPAKVIVFQKDAYEALKDMGCWRAPPTRVLQGKREKEALRRLLAHT